MAEDGDSFDWESNGDDYGTRSEGGGAHADVDPFAWVLRVDRVDTSIASVDRSQRGGGKGVEAWCRFAELEDWRLESSGCVLQLMLLLLLLFLSPVKKEVA